MAFDYFAAEEVEIAVIETGMGGRLDSTNIINPLASVITNISLDHMTFLGDTPALIAKEKAGIIKKEVPVIIGESDHQTDPVFLSVAARLNAPITFASECYSFLFSTLSADQKRIWRFTKCQGEILQLVSDLTGDYQEMNLKTLLCTLDRLKEVGYRIDDEVINKGLSTVIPSTGLRGRWETLGANPRIICDTGHNEAGIRQVLRQIDQVPRKKLHMIWGMVNDKDITHILPLLPKDANWLFTRSSVPRSLDPELLAEQAEAYGLKGTAFTSIREALDQARMDAGPDDLIFIGGSTFVVADALALFPSNETNS